MKNLVWPLSAYGTSIQKYMINVLYYYGQRWPSVHHARLRIGCSKLKYDLCYNLHVIENPNCTCGALEETTFHYFLACPHFVELRLQLFNVISVYCEVTLETILYGNINLRENQNKTIFDAVHNYIKLTQRFI